MRFAPRLLDGPLPTLPVTIDRLSERWWALPPRLRVGACGMLLAVAVLVAALHGGPSPTSTVLVATRDLAPGSVIGAADVTPVARAATELPPAAVRELPADTEVATTIPEGTVVTTRHLARGGLAAALPAGRVATAVPVESLPSAIRAGQHVDLLSGSPDGRSEVLASGARIMALEDGHVWFEVSRQEAAAVSAAASWGSIGIALLPPDGRAGPGQ